MNKPEQESKCVVVAIDPGVGGSIAVSTFGNIAVWHMPRTDAETVSLISGICRSAFERAASIRCTMERINGFMGRALPGSRMFTMGRNYGFIAGVFASKGVDVSLVQPRKWQSDLGLPKKGSEKSHVWKSKLYEKARGLYQNVQFTKQDADAVLILHWARFHANVPADLKQ